MWKGARLHCAYFVLGNVSDGSIRTFFYVTHPYVIIHRFQNASWIPSFSRSTFPWVILAIFNIAIAICGWSMNAKDYEVSKMDPDTQRDTTINKCRREDNNA